MSDRSELIKWILRTWDFSEEGRTYLEWLLQPEVDKLDGGAVLREAVLDVMEDDAQLVELRRRKQDSGLAELLSSFPPEKREEIQKVTDGINVSFRQMAQSWRGQAHSLRKIRHELNLDRIETLKVVSELIDSQPANGLTAILQGHETAREVASAVAALRRTRTEKIDIEARWKDHSPENPWTDMVESIANDPGEGWFDDFREKLDRYYAQEAVKRLDGVIDRAASLSPVDLAVKDSIVIRLFQEAHDVYLYGFDAAAIALCRSLIEHALKDKLFPGSRQKLEVLIKAAGKKGLLGSQSVEDARTVQQAGNKIMHDVANLQHSAQVVLDSTRSVLNELYGEETTT